MTRRLTFLPVLLMMGLISFPGMTAPPIKAAVVTGGHDFDQNAFPKLWQAMPDMECTLLPQKDDSELFEDITEWPYDVIVLYNMSQRISETRRQHFIQLLDRGVGLVVMHHAVAAFQEWAEYPKIIGCQYFIEEKDVNGVKYPKSGYQHDLDFTVTIADPNHPVTQGLKDFQIKDETYHTYVFDPNVHVLLTTNHPQSDRILGHAKTYGNANVCYIQPGHGPDIFENPAYQRLVGQAIRWAAKREPSVETVMDFKDLGAFRAPTGEWSVVGGVAQDPNDEKKLVGTPGTGAALNGPNGKTAHLVTQAEFGDVEAHIEFMVPKGSNSGVYFQGRYEIQVLDSWGVEHPKYGDCGGIYQRWHEEPGLQDSERGYEGRPPRVNASKKPGEWQTFDVVFRAPRFDASGKKTADAVFVSVKHNDVLVHENQPVTGPTRAAMFNDEKPTGPLMFQGDHGPVAYRNIRIRTLAPGSEDPWKQVLTYNFGQSRECLAAIENEIHLAKPADYAAIETKLLAVLQTPTAPLAAKQFVCKMLDRVGSAASVPVLAPMLLDESFSHMARFALERIADKSVDDALLDALSKTQGKLKIGMINSLGERRSEAAVKALVPLLQEPDLALVEAAASALGKIGGDDALDGLMEARKSTNPTVHEAASRACLNIADALLANGKESAAKDLFDTLYVPEEIPVVLVAAFRGRVRTRGADGAALVAEALQGGAPELQSTAIQLARQVPGKDATRLFAEALPTLDTPKKALLLAALADRRDPEAQEAVLTCMNDPDGDVRLAACKAVASVGDAAALPALLQRCGSGQAQEAEAARASLALLPDKKVNPALLEKLNAADTPQKTEIIRVLAARQAKESTPVLLALMRDADASLRAESCKALNGLADVAELPALIELLMNPPEAEERNTAAETITAVAQRAPEGPARTQPLLEALAKAPDTSAKAVVLGVLGKIADTASLEALRAAAKDPAPEVQDAAVRALAAWPAAAVLDDLLILAQTGSTEIHKVLALRGYIRLLGTASGRPAETIVQGYTEALKLAAQADEKRQVLAGLANLKSPEALNLALTLLPDAELQNEAAMALLKIAGNLTGPDAAAARAALQQVADQCKDETIRTQAREGLAKIPSSS